jgi:hypothetical protein
MNPTTRRAWATWGRAPTGYSKRLPLAPSKECGRCLLTKFALAQFTARLGFWRLGYERHLAFNIFDAVSPHPVTGRYTRPIHTAH